MALGGYTCGLMGDTVRGYPPGPSARRRAGTVAAPRRSPGDVVVRFFLMALVGLVALVVGLSFGWKYVFAPLLGAGIFLWALAMLRSMVNDGRARVDADQQQPRPVTGAERVVYWCEECGTELVLVVEGSGTPPRHCGGRMHERAELLSN